MNNFSDLYNTYIIESDGSSEKDKKGGSIWGFIGAFFGGSKEKKKETDPIQTAMEAMFKEKQEKLEEMRKQLLASKENAFIAKMRAKQALQLGQMDLRNKKKIDANNFIKAKLQKQEAYYKKSKVMLTDEEISHCMSYMDQQYDDINASNEETAEEKAKRLAFACAYDDKTGKFRSSKEIQDLIQDIESGRITSENRGELDEDTFNNFKDMVELGKTHEKEIKNAIKDGSIANLLDDIAGESAKIQTAEDNITEAENWKARRKEAGEMLNNYKDAEKKYSEKNEEWENQKKKAEDFAGNGLTRDAIKAETKDGKTTYTANNFTAENVSSEKLSKVIGDCMKVAKSEIADANDDTVAEKYKEELKKQLQNNGIDLGDELLNSITTQIPHNSDDNKIKDFDITARSLHGEKDQEEVNNSINQIKENVAKKIRTDAAQMISEYEKATADVQLAKEEKDGIKKEIEEKVNEKDEHGNKKNPEYEKLNNAIDNNTREAFELENNNAIDKLDKDIESNRETLKDIKARKDAAAMRAKEMQEASRNLRKEKDTALQNGAKKYEESLVPGEEFNDKGERGYYDEKGNFRKRPEHKGDSSSEVEMNKYQEKCKANFMTKTPKDVKIEKTEEGENAKYKVIITNPDKPDEEPIEIKDLSAEEAGKYEAMRKSKVHWERERKQQLENVAKKLKNTDPETIQDMCDPDSKNYDASVASVVNTMNSDAKEDEEKKKKLKDAFVDSGDFGTEYDLEKAVNDIYKYDKDSDENYEKDEEYEDDDNQDDDYEDDDELKNAKSDIDGVEDFKDTDGKIIKNPFKVWKRRKKKGSSGKTKNYYNKEDDSISAKEFKKRVERFKKRVEAKKKRDKEAEKQTNESLKEHLLRMLL